MRAVRNYPRRYPRMLAAGAATVALVLSAAVASSPATAEPGDPGYEITIDGASDLPLLAQGQSPVTLDLTLVTGDRVRVGVGGDGAPAVRKIVPAPRDGGADVAFHTITRTGQTYVVPADALSLVATDVLDLELFNIAKLAAHVLDGTVGEVPVIMTESVRAGRRSGPAVTGEVPGATVERKLPSIDGAALRIDGDGRWWDQVTDATGRTPRARAAGPLSGVEKVWLNELITVTLEDSVPMVEAPTAWAAGYDGTGVSIAVLDTGIDASHPDLAGKVAEAIDFTGDPDGAQDGHGHGTHVAATIAGTGAASDGLRPGVAPGATVLAGKVCNDGGSCTSDAIIAGMQWAASSGAQIVNMSLGGAATDGSDPLSQAVNTISEATGILFVIAAGNSGPDPQTVASPGAADLALTVAAVDDTGEVARFSSRGPRLGDGALKPDIAAPGVGIVAARAAGTAMGTPVDDLYTAASGTSMATPHVAGAAAVVAQRFPDLTGQEIKELLMESTTDLGHDPYAQGAGLLDVATAVGRTVTSTGQTHFGRLTYPHQAITHDLTYSNLTDQPMTLDLAATLGFVGGGAGPDGLVTVEPAELTVPGGGTAVATLTVDGRALGEDGPFGPYRGRLTATDGTGTVRSVDLVTALFEAERHEVTIDVIAPDGARDVVYEGIVVVPMDDQVHLHDPPLTLAGGPSASAGLYAGAYAVATAVRWQDAAGEPNTALVTVPEAMVTGPTTVTFDLREAKRAAVRMPQPTETNSAAFQIRRTSQTGAWTLTGDLSGGYGTQDPRWWTLPTGPVDHGTFTYANQQVLMPPLVTMRATGQGYPFDLHPRYVTADVAVDGQAQSWGIGPGESRYTVPMVPHLPELGRVPIVYAGAGTPDEVARFRTGGALVLLTPTDICAAACDYAALRERVDALAARGALGVVVAGDPSRVDLGRVDLGRPSTANVTCTDGPDSCPDPEPYSAVPVVSVPAAQAAELIQRLDRGKVRVELGGEPDVPEAYGLSFVTDRVPSDLPHRVTRKDLHPITHRIHGTRPGMINREGFQWARSLPVIAPQQETGVEFPRVATGQALTTLLGPRRPDAIEMFRAGTVYFDEPYVVSRPEQTFGLPIWSWPVEIQQTLLDGRPELTWNSALRLPGTPTGVETESGHRSWFGVCAGCREGDVLWPLLNLTGSTGGFTDRSAGVLNDVGAGFFLFFGTACEPPDCTLTLYDQSGTEIPQRLVPVGFTIGDAAEGGNR